MPSELQIFSIDGYFVTGKNSHAQARTAIFAIYTNTALTAAMIPACYPPFAAHFSHAIYRDDRAFIDIGWLDADDIFVPARI